MDEYFNVFERFTKDEAKAFITSKDEGRRPYENKVARFAKDHHLKLAAQRRTKKSSPYLIQAEKVLAKFSL